MNAQLPKKHPRLKNYDYGSNGYYYVTINTHENHYLEAWQYIDNNPLRYCLKKKINCKPNLVPFRLIGKKQKERFV
ncbi:MAG: hypothetical protein IJO03_01325 [Clostridia bacterium]|nr:hypothetical protein [Clostridia bacterium]